MPNLEFLNRRPNPEEWDEALKTIYESGAMQRLDAPLAVRMDFDRSLYVLFTKEGPGYVASMAFAMAAELIKAKAKIEALEEQVDALGDLLARRAEDDG